MPSTSSSTGHAGSLRRVTTVAESPRATSAPAEGANVVLAAPEHGMERLGQEENAGHLAPVSGRSGRPRARFASRLLAALVDHVDRLALALVVGAHEQLAHEAEVHQDHAGQEEQRAEEEQRPPADRRVEEEADEREVRRGSPRPGPRSRGP